jgi:hypothetical protein
MSKEPVGCAGEPGEWLAQLVVAGGEPVVGELQQLGELDGVSDGELETGSGAVTGGFPAACLPRRAAVRGRPPGRGGAAGSRRAAG